MTQRFATRVVVVTGAAKGQGRSHALRFAEEGADLVLADICRQLGTAGRQGTEEELVETAALVEKAGRRVLARVADVRDEDAVQGLMTDAVARFGRVDVLVSNAGIATYAPVAELSPEWWHEMIDINMGAAANCIRAVAPLMVARGSGRIVVTSSMAGREGVQNASHYAAAKWGVIGLVKSVAIELGPCGITVNAVAPMSVDTDMCHNDETYRLFRPDLAEPTRQEVAGTFAGLNVMGVPWLEPGDVSEAVLFLASDASRYTTGVVLTVAAGWNAKHLA